MRIRDTKRLLWLLDSSVPPGLEAYLSALSPVAWWRMRETSGTTAANSGSAGSSPDGTISGTTALGQTGQLGANEAFDFDGATSKITISSSAPVCDLTTWTWAFLINPASAGESNAGALFRLETSGTQTHYFTIVDAARTLRAHIAGVSSSVDAVTTTALALATWQWVFMTFDWDGDKKPHIYLGVGGSAFEASYTTPPGALSSAVNTATKNINIGNRASPINTFDGLIDEVMVFSHVLGIEQMQAIVQLSGV